MLREKFCIINRYHFWDINLFFFFNFFKILIVYSLTIVFKSETYFYHTNYIHLKEMSIDPSKCVYVNEYNYNELYLCLTLNFIFQKCHNCTLFEIIFTFELFLLTTSHSPRVQELTIERWHHDYSSKTRRTANRGGKMVFSPIYM